MTPDSKIPVYASFDGRAITLTALAPFAWFAPAGTERGFDTDAVLGVLYAQDGHGIKRLCDWARHYAADFYVAGSNHPTLAKVTHADYQA